MCYGNKNGYASLFPASSAQSKGHGRLKRDVRRYSSEQPWYVCVASVLCKLLISFLPEIFNSIFLFCFGFFHVGVHIFTVSLQLLLPFCSVFGKVPFNIQFCQRFSFCLVFHRPQAASYQVFSSCFPGLFPEYSPPDFCHTSGGRFFT